MKNHLKEKLIEMLKSFPTVQACCKKLGIARATYYRWIDEDFEFRKKCRTALDDGIFEFSGIAENNLLSMIQEGNMGATYFWLKKKHEGYMPIGRLERTERDDEKTDNSFDSPDGA